MRESRTNLQPGMGELKQGGDPWIQDIRLEQKRSIWSHQRVKQPTCDRLSGVRTTPLIHAGALHTPDRDGNPPEGAASGSWRMGIGGQSGGKGCCWLRGQKGWEERNPRRGVPLEERRAAMKIRRYCWVTHRGRSHRWSRSLHTQLTNGERLQRAQSWKCLLGSATEKDPSQGCPWSACWAERHRRTPAAAALGVPAGLSHREGPQPGVPLECLLGWATEEDPSQGCPWSACWAEPQRRTPARAALGVPAGLSHREGPHRAALGVPAGLSHREGHHRAALGVPTGLSHRETSQAGPLSSSFQELEKSPNRTTSPAPVAPASLCTGHSQGPRDPSRHTSSTWSSLGRPKSSRAASGANSRGWPTCEGGLKPQLSSRGGLPKEEDQNLSTSCTRHRLNPRHQLGRLGRWNTQKDNDCSHRRNGSGSGVCGQWRQAHAGVGSD